MFQIASSEREIFWRELRREIEPRLRGYLRRIRCDDLDDIENLIWDIWADLCDREPDVNLQGDAWTLILPFVRERCAAYVRRRRHEVCFSTRELDSIVDHAPVDEADAEQDIAIRTWLLTLLSQLPERQRVAITCRIQRGLPYRLVALEIGAPEATARVYVKRGLSTLRRLAKTTDPRT